MRFRFLGFVMMAAMALTVMSADAWAEKGGRGKGRDHAEDSAHRSSERHDDDKVTIRIGDMQRHTITKYLRSEVGRNCPPGLAKKNNGCLPPGIAKKYAVGSILPDDVVTLPLPAGLLEMLGPAPLGHQYVQVDKDVLLISEAGKKVIDAVTLLSAVGE